MSDQIDINQFSNALQQKVDLPSGKSQADIDYVVEFQAPDPNNDYKWYRLYKSGWIEQGGITPGTTDGIITVNFLVPYLETPSIQLTRNFQSMDNTGTNVNSIGTTNIKLTSFQCWDLCWPSGVKGTGMWEAKGFAAQS